MVAASYTGNYVGIMVSMPASGLLATSFGWEWIFYFFGIIGLVWFLLWILIVKRSPEHDQNMSQQEKEFIWNSLKSQTTNKKVPVPWKSIFKSTAVWAIIAAQFSEGWGFFTLQTQLPQFLNDVLKFDLTKSGFASSIPYLAMAFMLQIAGYLADWVQIKGYWTTKQTRKYFNTFAFISQAASLLLAVSFLTPVVSVFFISCGVALAAFAYTSFSVNYLDIGPQFAGSTNL
jgi:ACS family sodium-dependent inorganic phosphate cotransporter